MQRLMILRRQIGTHVNKWVMRYLDEANNPPQQQQLLLNTLQQTEANSFITQCLRTSLQAVPLAMQLRVQMQDLKKKKSNDISDTQMKELVKASEIVDSWLASVFSDCMLQLRRITFDDACGNTLEHIARTEAVHRIRSLSELKRRLHDGRRCYALFLSNNQSLFHEPVAFIHVALTNQLCDSLR